MVESVQEVVADAGVEHREDTGSYQGWRDPYWPAGAWGGVGAQDY